MKWRVKIQNSKLLSRLNIKKIIEVLLSNRGLETKKEQEDFLKPSMKLLEQDFFEKKEVEKALKRIKDAIKKKETIIVYSDYDADGITGGAIVWETLRDGGASVFPYVPDRIADGYGLSKNGIDNIKKSYLGTKLIITVDHGITAEKQVEYAREQGIDVIITDHHTFPPKLPEALAIIHSLDLSGSGVAYIFSGLIRKSLNLRDGKDHLSLAAFGTIADLVPLVGPNRVIAAFGLAELSKTKRIGIRALLETSFIEKKKLTPYDVSFILAPKINAAGRLTHALDSLRLLCTKDEKRAGMLAEKLNRVNLDRQQMLASSVDHAKKIIGGKPKDFIFISDESYHEGVIGLIAGKLTEEFYRPSVVIARKEKYSKASARSIAGFNIIDAIREVSDILVDCGGHPMAAGFTVETKNIETVKKRLQKVVEEKIEKKFLEKVLQVDLELDFASISGDFFQRLEKFAPFGIGNPEPVFSTSKVKIISARVIGRDSQHLKLHLQADKDGERITFEAVGFGMGSLYDNLSPAKTYGIAYTIFENSWNGESKLQLRLRDIKHSDA